MIGQAGTGSPEAGIVLQRRSPCSCLHLADGGTRQDTQGPRADSGVQSAADARNLDSIYHPRGSYYTLAQKKTSLSLQGIGLSRVISVLHSEQKCVKLFSDFFGTSAGSGVQVLLDMKSTRNSPNRLFLYTHRV